MLAKLRMASDSAPKDPNRTFRILIADEIADQVRAELQGEGHEVIFEPDLSGQTLTSAIAEHLPEVLVVRSTRVVAADFAAGPQLQLVIRAGSGVDNIDLSAAQAGGARVANCAGANAVAVAELTWGLILACDREIAAQDADLKAGKWQKGLYAARASKRSGLKGRTLGVVGYGSIGQTVAKIAAAFGMTVAAWSRSLTADNAPDNVQVCSSLAELASLSDVVTVHAASNRQPLIGAEFFAAMRNGAIFINAARGSVVDEKALLEAIDTKGLRVGMDVYDNEPSPPQADFSSALAKRSESVGTHHVGASTQQAQDAVGEVLLAVVASYRASGTADTMVV